MIFYVAGAKAQTDEITNEVFDKTFRRATPNMKLTYLAVKRLWDQLPYSITEHPDKLGLVFASSHGELDATKDYLKYLAEGHGRPYLFQSSMHNSTTGFLAAKFQLTGPSFTTSLMEFSGESAIELATGFINDGTFSSCLVVGCDIWQPLFNKTTKFLYNREQGESSGAAAILLTSDPAIGKSEFLGMENKAEDLLPENSPFFGCDTLFKMVHAIEENPKESELKIPKPNQSTTHIKLRPL